MPRTISDEEYNYLHNCRQVVDLVSPVYNDAQLGKEARRLLKRKYPTLPIPELDMEDRFDEQEKKLAAAEKKRVDEEAEKTAASERERYKADREATRKKYGFTDDAMGRLDKLMQDRLVADYDVAGSYLASQEPKPSEVTYDSTRWHHERADNFAEISRDPEAWARDELMKAFQADTARSRNQI